MESERRISEKRAMSSERSGEELERLEVSSQGGGAARRESHVEKLLTADWGDRRGKPLTADELLIIGREAFEPLFQEPPVGPIPEYLVAHLSVHGCVTEYEEKLEELDRWKALQLGRWLKERLGSNWSVSGRTYELRMENEEAAASEKFWFKLIEDPTERGKLTSDENWRHGGPVAPSKPIYYDEREKHGPGKTR